MFGEVDVGDQREPVGRVGGGEGQCGQGEQEGRPHPRVGHDLGEHLTEQGGGTSSFGHLQAAQRDEEEGQEEGDAAEDSGGAEQRPTPGGAPLPAVAEHAGDDREQAPELEDGGEQPSYLGGGLQAVALRLDLALVQERHPHQRAVGELRGEALCDEPQVGATVQQVAQVGRFDLILVAVAGGEQRLQGRLLAPSW